MLKGFSLQTWKLFSSVITMVLFYKLRNKDIEAGVLLSSYSLSSILLLWNWLFTQGDPPTNLMEMPYQAMFVIYFFRIHNMDEERKQCFRSLVKLLFLDFPETTESSRTLEVGTPTKSNHCSFFIVLLWQTWHSTIC